MTVPTMLYRFYDPDGNLLYVGISADAEVRLKQHECRSCWHPAAVAVKVAIYPDRKQASAAEIEAIKTEEPVWNDRPNQVGTYMYAVDPVYAYGMDAPVSEERSWELFDERVSHDFRIRRLMAAAVREAWHAYLANRATAAPGAPASSTRR